MTTPHNPPDTRQNPRSLIPISDLIQESLTIPFLGLTPHDDSTYPTEVTPRGRRFNQDADSFKAAINRLPNAVAGGLTHRNRFVEKDGTLNLSALEDVDIDLAQITDATDASLHELATAADRGHHIPVDDHKDIIDERRLALYNLGYNIKFRWQVATDSYGIINPQDAFYPAIAALQKRGENDVFGWMHLRDYGGIADLYTIFPSLSETLDVTDIDPNDYGVTIGGAVTNANQDGDLGDGGELTVMYGIQSGYSFRGDRAYFAKPFIYLPQTDTIIPGVGSRRTRRHVGLPTDAAHERANDRVPLSEWHGNVYDQLDTATTKISAELLRSRAIGLDFSGFPFSVEDFYTYLGVPAGYAAAAAKRAKNFAADIEAPTIWNLQLSLLRVLDAEFSGAPGSRRLVELQEISRDILQTPGFTVQLAFREHDLQTDDDEEKVLSEHQTSLTDSVDDIAQIPGISASDEASLSNAEAAAAQESVQSRLSTLV